MERGRRGEYEYDAYAGLAREKQGRDLSPREISWFWVQQGFGYLKERPRDYLRLLGRKFVCFWNAYESHDTREGYLRQRELPLRFLLPGFFLIAPLGILGLCSSLGQWRRHFLLYLVVAAYLLSALLFSVAARFRLPAVPPLIILAALGLEGMYRCLRERRFLLFLLSLLLLVGAFAAVNRTDRSLEVIERRLGTLNTHYFDCLTFAHQGRMLEAEAALGRVGDNDPALLPRAHWAMGIAYSRFQLGGGGPAPSRTCSLGRCSPGDDPLPACHATCALAGSGRRHSSSLSYPFCG